MTADEFVAEMVRLANQHGEVCREDCKVEDCPMGDPYCEVICEALDDYGLIRWGDGWEVVIPSM